MGIETARDLGIVAGCLAMLDQRPRQAAGRSLNLVAREAVARHYAQQWNRNPER
jgi:hypothetical protein